MIDYDYNDTLSVISSNENIVAISVSHMVCDGGFFIDIFDKLLLDYQYPMHSFTPLTTSHIFKKELSSVTKNQIQNYQRSVFNLTSLKWSQNFNELKKTLQKNHYADI